jgi:hypothetical protein
MLTYATGTQERLSCRVQYAGESEQPSAGTALCGGQLQFPDQRVLDSANGRLSGNAELVNNVKGSVSGTVANGSIKGDLKGPGFNASLLVVTKGDRQTVNIQAPIEEIRGVSIEVRKAAR